jgi:serine/threonine-protein kinase
MKYQSSFPTTTRGRARPLLLAALLAASLPANTASAQAPDEKAIAETLFADGKKFMAAGKHAEACPKFEESQRLDPAIGTTFQLALCYEALGRTASAWALYLEAASRSAEAKQKDREQAARRRAKALEEHLARLTIRVDEPDTYGLSVERDGGLVGRGQWGAPVPVDPGEHTVVVKAEGRAPYITTIRVEPRQTETVVVPRLVLLKPAPPERPMKAVKEPGAEADAASHPPLSASKKRGLGPWRIAALAGGGVGVAGIAVGLGFGALARSKNEESMSHCPNNVCIDEEGKKLRNDAIAAGNTATALVIGGGALVAASTALFFLSPTWSRKDGASLSIHPRAGIGGAAVTVEGRY